MKENIYLYYNLSAENLKQIGENYEFCVRQDYFCLNLLKRSVEELKDIYQICEELKSKNKTILSIDITNLNEEEKKKLRGAIKYFTGERNNMPVQVIENGEIKPCGAIYLTDEILEEIKELVGNEIVKLEELVSND